MAEDFPKIYYPQALMVLRARWEDFGDTTKNKLDEVYRLPILCKSISVTYNSYREADEFNATIDYKAFPFDPRNIRALGVEVYIDDRKHLFNANNSLNLLNPDTTEGKKNLIFLGFVDEESVSFDENQRIINFSGRDFTSLLIDRPFIRPNKPGVSSADTEGGTKDPLPITRPVDQIIQELVGELEETKSIVVVNQTGETLPAKSLSQNDNNEAAGKKNSRPKKTYWDAIQNLVADTGLIAYIALDKLIITKPRNLFNRNNSKRFIYGKNLMSLEFSRRLGRQKGFNIKVVSVNFRAPPGTDPLIKVLIPKQATDEWAKDIGVRQEEVKVPNIGADGEQKEPKVAPYYTFRLADVPDEKELIEKGQSIYEEMSRQQIEGTLTTKEMKICDTNNDFFDVRQFRVGVPIEVTMEQKDLKSINTFKSIQGSQQRKSAIKAYLQRNCYNDKLADALAETLGKVDTPFYTKDVTFSLDQDSGFSMEIGFINFIELPKNLR